MKGCNILCCKFCKNFHLYKSILCCATALFSQSKTSRPLSATPYSFHDTSHQRTLHFQDRRSLGFFFCSSIVAEEKTRNSPGQVGVPRKILGEYLGFSSGTVELLLILCGVLYVNFNPSSNINFNPSSNRNQYIRNKCLLLINGNSF